MLPSQRREKPATCRDRDCGNEITAGVGGGRAQMTHKQPLFWAAVGLLLATTMSNPALAQRQGGILRQYIIDSPASMSIHEETTVVAERPMMAVMSNLVLFDQHVAQNSLGS